jgi:hypothetical protein
MPNEIVVQEHRSAAIAKPTLQDGNGGALLSLVERFASNPDLDPEKAEKLIKIFIDGQRQMLTISDEQAFAHAMADFKKNPPDIIKSRIAKMVKEGRELYTYNFADLDAFATASQAGLAERGITWSFIINEGPAGITVSCILRYGLYNHTPCTLSSPPDQTGGKNAIQAKASTLSYLERYTFCGATGLTAGLPDTDGNKLTPKQAEESGCLEEGAEADFIASIEGSGDVDELQRNYFAARDAAGAAKDKRAATVFAATKNAIYKRLTKKAVAK